MPTLPASVSTRVRAAVVAMLEAGRTEAKPIKVVRELDLLVVNKPDFVATMRLPAEAQLARPPHEPDGSAVEA